MARAPIKKWSKKKRSYKWKGKKRSFKKPPQATTAVAKIGFSSGLNFLPDKFVARLKWNKTFNLGAGTTDVGQFQSFVLTSLNDPEDAVSSSLQPYGYDQLMTYYQHNIVLRAKPTVRFVHKSGNPMIAGVVLDSDLDKLNLGSGNRDEFINDPQSRYRILHNEHAIATIKGPVYSKRKVYGTNRDHDLTCPNNTDPVEKYFLHTYLCNLGPGDTQASIVMTVEIEFTALFTERRVIAKS